MGIQKGTVIKILAVVLICSFVLLLLKDMNMKSLKVRSTSVTRGKLSTNISRLNTVDASKKEQLKKEESKKEVLKKEEIKKEQLKKEEIKKEQLKKDIKVLKSEAVIELVHPELATATPNYIPPIPEYALVNKSLCKDPRIRYLIYTYSTPGGFEIRNTIRQTYGNKEIYKDKRLERVFFLAQPKDENIQKKIEEEAKQYGDIVQAKYIDTYPNLTLKGIFTFKFFHDHCRKDIIAIKTDDDLFYDIFLLMDKFKSPPPNERFIGCPVFYNNSMPILRDPKSCSKWCVREDELKGRKTYPQYCSGWIWVFPLNFVDVVLKAIERTHFLRVEDAFISGIVMGQVPKLKYITLYPDYPPPGKPGMWHLTQQYTNASIPRKYILADIANKEHLNQMWKLSLGSLFNKSRSTYDQLDLNVLSKYTKAANAVKTIK